MSAALTWAAGSAPRPGRRRVPQLRGILSGLVLAICRNQDFLQIARLELPDTHGCRPDLLCEILGRVIAIREANEDGLIEEADRGSEQLEADLRGWIEGSQ